MKQFEVIDAHSHIYPDKIAAKASRSIGEFYHLPILSGGTADELLAEGREAGVSRFVVHSCATSVHQVRAINTFVLSEMQLHPEFIGFMTLHPDMEREDIKKEIAWGMENGFRGIKLHADFQQFYIDEARARKIYDEARGLLPILFHAGDRRYSYSCPTRLATIARDYPDLTVIGAHFGGYSEWEKVSCYKGLRNVYLDTCSTLAFIGKDEAKKFIDYFGAEWFFFGVDYPMWNVKEELARFMEIDLTDDQRELILAKNIKRLLKISG